MARVRSEKDMMCDVNILGDGSKKRVGRITQAEREKRSVVIRPTLMKHYD